MKYLHVGSGAECVAIAAEWMDEHYPGWAHRIDVGTLDMHDSSRCILGQAVDRDAWGKHNMATHGERNGYAPFVQVVSHEVPNPFAGKRPLTVELWRNEIAARLLGDEAERYLATVGVFAAEGIDIKALPETVECPERELEGWPA